MCYTHPDWLPIKQYIRFKILLINYKTPQNLFLFKMLFIFFNTIIITPESQQCRDFSVLSL